MKILLSPHDDDQALFAAFTCIREKPLVVICLDSWIQPNRGEVGCSAADRAAETEAACEILGVNVLRLGIRDDSVTEKQIEAALQDLNDLPLAAAVYGPAEQVGGNAHHSLIARAALVVFGDRLRRYTTYTRTELYTTGDIEIVPTPEELDLKAQALACYASQLRINGPHFDAVRGKSEWFLR